MEHVGPMWNNGRSRHLAQDERGVIMGKGGRKRRARRKNAANHGKRPNA
jgi:hypothetical protein